MPDAEPTAPRELEAEVVEAGILDRLTDADDQRPWSVAELIRDIGQRIATEDALTNLHGLGLINRAGELVFPTRAALRFEQLRM